MKRLLKLLAVNAVLFFILAGAAVCAVEWAIGTPSDSVPVLTRSPTLGWDAAQPVEALPGGAETGPLTVFLGDSFTFQMEWPRRALEIIRESRPETRGANLAVPGYGTYQEFLKLKEHFNALRPSAVVLLFFVWNDLRDNFPYPGIFYNIQTRERPYWGMVSFRPHFPGFVANSKIYERFTVRVTQIALDEEKRRIGVDAFAREHRPGVFLYDDIETWAPFYDPAKQSTPYVKAAWENTEQILGALQRFLGEKQCPLYVIGIDNALTVDGDVFEQWVVKRGLSDHFESGLPLKKLGKVLESLGVSYVSALPQLRTLPGKVYSGAPGHVGDYLGKEGEAKLAEISASLVLASPPRQ